MGFFDNVITSLTSGGGMSGTFDSDLNIPAPNYGYADYLNDLSNWRKQLTSAYGDPGWFYFKIFFHFDTSFGLFGGTLGNGDETSNFPTEQKNCALKFFKTWKDAYPQYKLDERAVALQKFAAILSFINCKAPWFWQGISGLDKAGFIDLKEPFKKRQIEIDCLEDAVDMRLTTIMDLYKFACFDYINFKEILPENLRKFDMSVVIFSAPIMYLHTKTTTSSGTFGNKDMAGTNNERMGFKMFTFKNCEFVGDGLGNYVPADISNAAPFQLGKNKITIQYDRCYQHTSSEFNQIVFGDTGVFENKMSKNASRLNVLSGNIDNSSFEPNAKQYKKLIDETEEVITDALRAYQPKIVTGNSNSSSGSSLLDMFKKWF